MALTWPQNPREYDGFQQVCVPGYGRYAAGHIGSEMTWLDNAGGQEGSQSFWACYRIFNPLNKDKTRWGMNYPHQLVF